MSDERYKGLPVWKARTTLIAGRYELGRSLGTGGMAQVYSATDNATGDTVALKLIDHPSDRIAREIAALSLLRLPGVVRYRDHGVHEGRTFIVMDRVEGARWPGTASREWSDIRGPTLGLLEAVARCHAAGVIHRDLKPGNVMVRRDGQVVLLDFGLARGAPLGQTITQSRHVLGTPKYLPPEQMDAKRCDERADLYAVGLMVYEALTGSVPHAEATWELTLHMRNTRDVRSLRYEAEVPEAVVQQVDRMLRRARSERPSSAAEVLDALKGAMPELPRLGPDRIQPILERLRQGQHVVVWGPPGSGRSRLLRDVAAEWSGGVVTVGPGSTPLQSLVPLVGEPPTTDGAAHAAGWLDGCTDLVVADDFDAVDTWSQRVMRGASGPQLRVADEPGALHLDPLTEAELRTLFTGPNRILHLREDAARELLRRTDGLAGRVDRQLRAWTAEGRIARDADGFRASRQTLDLLIAETRPLRTEAATGPLPDPLAQTLGWVRFAHPNATMAALQALTRTSAWELRMTLDELQSQGAVQAVDDHWEPIWDHTDELEDEDAAHATMADALAVGTPGRLEHLVAAGLLDRLADEALARADALEEVGHTGQAVELLTSVVGMARPFSKDAAARLVRLVIDRDDGRDLQPALAAVAQDPQAVALLRAWSSQDATTPPSDRPELELARHILEFRVAQKQGVAAQRRFVDTQPAIPRDRLLVWTGLTAYRERRFEEAARLHLQAQALRTGSTWLSATLNACSALLACGDLDQAERLAQRALDAARAVRHPVYEARAEWVMRSAANRRGAAGTDRELLEVSLGHRVPNAPLLLMTEAWCALRGGERVEAARAAEALRDATSGAMRLVAEAILSVANDRPLTVDLTTMPDAMLPDTLAMLVWAGRLPPELLPEARRLASSPPPFASPGFFTVEEARAHLLAAAGLP